MSKIILSNLNPKEYEHPSDKIALSAVNKIPILQTATKKFIEIINERQTQIIKNGSNIRFSNKQYPKIYQLFQECCEVLEIEKEPPFFLEYGRDINAYTTGVENPILCVNERTVEVLSDDELRFIIGHELGHIKSGHCLNHTLVRILSEGVSSLFGVLELPLREALFAWDRMSEFTADRAGLLCCQSLEATVSTLGKLSGCVFKYKESFNYDAFLKQALTFKKEQGTLLNQFKTKAFYFMYESDHPLTVLRAAEIYEWFNSEQYKSILNNRKLLLETS